MTQIPMTFDLVYPNDNVTIKFEHQLNQGYDGFPQILTLLEAFF
ncbi:hypothetical protein PTW35_19925 (plasmid) [Photobacterium sp. DA100]|nr:hypothetical protein [Photobacterium sp. DA100]WEM45353.1 hypothetical protein PTW35_19925 [Photobacterium sp. DA100]